MALKLNRERIGLIGRWLAVALLIAQFGAEIHLYSHPLAESSEKLGTVRNCGICLASSQLQNAVSVTSPDLPARSIAWVTCVAEAGVPQTHSTPFRAFRSRAPPAFV